MFSGEHAYRAVIPVKDAHRLVTDDNRRFYMGESGTIAYNLPLRHRGQLSFDITAPFEGGSWAPEISTEYLVKILDGFDERIIQVARELDLSQVTSLSVFDIDSIDSWHTDCVALLGDAAHAMLHHQGQGGNSAILDAGGFADALVHGDSVKDALAIYEAIRKPLTDNVLSTLPAPDGSPLDPVAMRAGEAAQVPPLQDRLPLHAVEDLNAATPSGDVPVRIYTPVEADAYGLLVYFHGGAFFLGSLDTHDHVARAMAKETGHKVISGATGSPPRPTSRQASTTAKAWSDGLPGRAAASAGTEKTLPTPGTAQAGISWPQSLRRPTTTGSPESPTRSRSTRPSTWISTSSATRPCGKTPRDTGWRRPGCCRSTRSIFGAGRTRLIPSSRPSSAGTSPACRRPHHHCRARPPARRGRTVRPPPQGCRGCTRRSAATPGPTTASSRTSPGFRTSTGSSRRPVPPEYGRRA